jgi:hypothetical protein
MQNAEIGLDDHDGSRKAIAPNKRSPNTDCGAVWILSSLTPYDGAAWARCASMDDGWQDADANLGGALCAWVQRPDHQITS